MRFLLVAFLSLFAGVALAQTAPALTFSASPTSGVSPLAVTLTWSSTGATSCTASGAWSGTKALSGSETLTNVTANATYTLTCSAATGSARLTWTAPTQNTDGSPLTNLAGYKVYHAPTSAGVAAATPITVTGATTTSYTLTGLPAGVRYYGMKAFTTAGVDSDMSNIATNTVSAPSASQSVSVTVSTKPNPPTLVTVAQVVYDMSGIKNDGTILLGRAVGTVPLGTACIDYQFVTNKGTFYGIDRANVTFTRPPRSSMVVASCMLKGA